MQENPQTDSSKENNSPSGDHAAEKGFLDEKQEKVGQESAPDPMIKIKESDYKKLNEEAVQYKDRYVRLYAEFENARKRMEREKIEFMKYANEELIIEFLAILDNLERSIEAAKTKHQDYEAFLKGVEMVMTHIHEMLKKNGVRPIEAKGKMFDPHCHEVLMQEETDLFEDGIVMEEFQKGYYLGDKVVRTVKAKVAKK
ncbi:MAG TPA: nucleotide exchange factor GrpE [Candidatus Omnitrophica bacterium]|nr:MAG: nucleotide exchange factor GrpE [Omnitrophica WOR_2 bacterium GWA2_45_18]HBR14454.1 nucleotide exchange factor GrpE [Candidatus Omnitrophota bacterium]